MNRTVSSLSVITLGVFLASQAMAGGAMTENRDPVRDMRGGTVHDMRGGCVVTKWQSANSKCTAIAVETAGGRVLDSVYFDYNSSKLSADSKRRLDKLTKSLGSKSKKLKLVGFADRTGGSDYNMRLSQKRADAVKQYLEAKGISVKAEVKAKGASESRTSCKGDKVTSDLIQCLSEDRRVDVKMWW